MASVTVGEGWAVEAERGGKEVVIRTRGAVSGDIASNINSASVTGEFIVVITGCAGLVSSSVECHTVGNAGRSDTSVVDQIVT